MGWDGACVTLPAGGGQQLQWWRGSSRCSFLGVAACTHGWLCGELSSMAHGREQKLVLGPQCWSSVTAEHKFPLEGGEGERGRGRKAVMYGNERVWHCLVV